MEKDKYKIVSELLAGNKPTEIAKKLNISYGKVFKAQSEFEEASKKGLVNNILEKLDEESKNLLKNSDGLLYLTKELQNTAFQINSKVKNLLKTELTVRELQALTNITTSLQMSFVNKNMTQVNIQNNFEQTKPKYTEFLKDEPDS